MKVDTANHYEGGHQIIQVIETKGSFENVKTLMLQVFAGEDIMDNMPPVVQTAAVVGGVRRAVSSCLCSDSLRAMVSTCMAKIAHNSHV